MWDRFSPFWQFISVVLIAWITQKIIAYQERRKRMQESQMKFYLSIVEHIARVYRLALDESPRELRGQIQEEAVCVLLRLSIIGSIDVMNAWDEFMEYALSGGPIDPAKLLKLASSVTYQMCREIHGEKQHPPVSPTVQPT